MNPDPGSRVGRRWWTLGAVIFAIAWVPSFSACGMGQPRCETKLADGGSSGFNPDCSAADAGSDAGAPVDGGACDGGSDGGC